MQSFLYTADKPEITGQIRQIPEDFIVEEVLGFEADGEGEHVFLQIEKKGLSTFQLIRQLSQRTGVKERDIGFCGMKDKDAVTRQTISLFLRQEREPQWETIGIPGASVRQSHRHQKKLRRGIHKGNRFQIIVRELKGDLDQLRARLTRLTEQGAPNYFGEQRFGWDNLDKARSMLEGELTVKNRQQRSLYLSAARSWLFNRILSERLLENSWDRYMDGDVLMHDGKKSYFTPDTPEQEQQRLENKEIHPTGALFGKGESPVTAEAAALERNIFDAEKLLCDGLITAGLKHERRALRLIPRQLEWNLDEDAATLELTFMLNRGEFATSVLRELVIYDQTSQI